MQQTPSIKWQATGLILLALLLMIAATLSMTITATSVSAQGAEPTATPSDPVWRAFTAVRSAIEEEKSVDLTIVQSYTFEQVEWELGIDIGCDEDVSVVDARPAYFGWDFLITDLFGKQYSARVAFDLSAIAVCDQVVQSSSSSSSGEAAPANPDLPSPVAGSGATGSFELGGHVLGLGTDTVEYMRSAGMTWVKKQLRYNLGDSPSVAQTMIDDAHSKGFKILLGIVGEPDQMGDFNSYISSFADFVGGVSALGADAIEVWNEPNLAREWPAGTIDGARYTQLLAAAFNAIKTSHASTIVISGAPAPTGAEAAFPGEVVNDDRFMAQMRDAGAANYMDCVGLHYNEGIVSPGTTSGDPRGEFPSYYFGSMFARGNLFGRPVCWTELGYLSGDGFDAGMPALFAWAENVTVAQQAAWLADAAARSAQLNIRLMIVWNVNFQTFGADPQGGYAIIRPDGTCPACSTLGTVMGR